MIAVAIAILILLVFLWIVGKGFPIVFRGCIDFSSEEFFNKGRKGGQRVIEKITKTCLDLSAVIGVIGAGLFLAGMIIGPDWSVLKDKGMQYFGWAEKVNVLADGKGFDSDGLETIYAKLDTEAKQEYEFSKEEVSSLSIETEEKNAIYLEFKTDANASSIKVKSYNSADVVEYDREDRELSIEREGKNHQGEKDPIEIILPAGYAV